MCVNEVGSVNNMKHVLIIFLRVYPHLLCCFSGIYGLLCFLVGMQMFYVSVDFIYFVYSTDFSVAI